MEQNLEKFNFKNIFIKMFLKKGKKENSEKFLKKIFIELKKKTHKKPNIILNKVFSKILAPKLNIIKVPSKKKKKNKFFLMFLERELQIKKGIKWFLLSKNKKFSNEILKIYKKRSKIIKIKKDHYKKINKLKFNILRK